MSLQIKNLVFAHGPEDKMDYPGLVLESGGHGTILGKSGTGKTTLLHLIAGLLPASTGSIRVYGQELTGLSEKHLDNYRREKVGIVFQKPYLVSSLSVLNNLNLSPFFARKKITSDRLEELANRLSIKNLFDKKPNQLSQGQAQRVAIARSILHEPRLILADEPTSSLDDENTRAVIDLLTEEAKRLEASLLISTHDSRVTDLVRPILTLT